jgi:hypothetical protein
MDLPEKTKKNFMREYLKELPDEFWNFIMKTLPFSLAAIAISISIQIKNKTASLVNAFMSIIIGISCAYITGAYINDTFSPKWAPIIIGIITITGEKIAYWLIYKFNVDELGEAAVKSVIKKFKK